MFYLLIAVIAVYIIFEIRRNQKQKKPEPNYDAEFIDDEEAYNKGTTDLVDFEDKYFERIKSGEFCQQFLILGGQQDCSVIRSLLAADDIPSYVENENVNRMYGGTPAAVTGVFALKLFILVNDYDKAYDIVCGYAKSKKEEFEEQSKKEKSKIETSAEIVTGLFFAPYPTNCEQKSMGITILPKYKYDE